MYISEKSIPKSLENHQRLVEGDQIYKIENFDSAFSTNEGFICKENSISREKIKIGCLRTKLDFV
jgi:hypothetical protein